MGGMSGKNLYIYGMQHKVECSPDSHRFSNEDWAKLLCLSLAQGYYSFVNAGMAYMTVWEFTHSHGVITNRSKQSKVSRQHRER